MSRAAATLGFCVSALSAAGCGYDLDRLRPPRDGSTDATPGPACARTRGLLDAREVGAVVGPSLVITGSTVGAPSLLTPPQVGSECTTAQLMSPAPEVVYRYVMQRGTRLYATTDAAPCSIGFDSVVHISASCDPGAGAALACNDDDRVLAECTAAPGGTTPNLASSALATGLAPDQTVYVVVDSFGDRAGTFRLTLTEDGAVNAAPPNVSAAGPMLANRCACPTSANTHAETTVPFPSPTNVAVPADGRLRAPGDTLGGTTTVATLHRVAGVALDTRLSVNELGVGTNCQAAKAVVDLVFDDQVVQSFAVTAQTPAPAPLRVAFQTFAPLPVPDPPTVRVALRLRAVTPSGCGAISFDRDTPGTLTLRGE